LPMKIIDTKKSASLIVAHFDGNQAATARACGVSQPTVHGWVSGAHKISPQTAIRIEKATCGKFKAVNICAALSQILNLVA
jgi:DNA-binding transcriptional regulator YdaS (Cro superfamily)